MELLPIQELLRDRLQKAIDLQGKILRVNNSSNGASKIYSQDLPLQWYDDGVNIACRSAIALQLSRSWGLTPLDIAIKLTTHLHDLPEFQIRVIPPGWIHFYLTEPIIAYLLQSIAQTSIPMNSQWIRSVKSDRLREQQAVVFWWQYAHARCCSLLRLAEKEGAITRGVCSFPWLTPENQLRLVHPTERAAIFQLLATVDSLCCPPVVQPGRSAEKLSRALSQRFLTFYRVCRLWGEVKIQVPVLVTARLGLVMATQKVLRVLLEEVLDLSAPTEL